MIRGDAGMGRRCWPYGQWLLAGFCCLSGTFGPAPGLGAEARLQLGPGAFDVRVEKAEPAPLRMTPLDKKFLRSLKITVDHDEE